MSVATDGPQASVAVMATTAAISASREASSRPRVVTSVQASVLHLAAAPSPSQVAPLRLRAVKRLQASALAIAAKSPSQAEQSQLLVVNMAQVSAARKMVSQTVSR